MILCNFRKVLPAAVLKHEDTISWIALAHSRSEALKSERSGKPPEKDFLRSLSAMLNRYGCSKKSIQTRGTESLDFTHHDWKKMELFSISDDPSGPTMSQRMRVFRRAGNRVCERIYPLNSDPPDHLIHVTCTGYISPSCAQEIVSANNWHKRTVVTHAYHMGCYAALPAVAIAEGFLRTPGEKRVDLLHTEVCSIHLQPFDHSPEQLVVQSLFADGFIKYSALNSRADHLRAGPGLRLKGLHEELIQGTANAITWECSEWGMIMGLSRNVPDLIVSSLAPFVKELCRRTRVSFQAILKNGIFAIHPGGPKIIDRIQETLNLSDFQVQASRDILRKHGNMSSATIPHVWESIAADSSIPEKTRIVSLAFGPGLCISGALLVKVK